MKITRILSPLLALLLILGCFAGCGKEKEADDVLMPSISTTATGRYVEKTIALPESRYPKDLTILSDGRLRVALEEEDGTILICTGSQDGSWEETISLPGEILSSGNVESVALASDGSIFCNTVQEQADETYQLHFWFISPSGEHREVPITYESVDPTMGYFIPNADFTADGRLMLQFYLDEMRELNTQTGELSKNLNELGTNLLKLGCAGNSVYMLSMNSGSVHQNGETKVLPDVLKAQIGASLEETYGNTPRIVFWENGEGYLFFTTHEGLYSYIPGGSVTEELLSGARCSLGDPSFVPLTMVGTEDGGVYILAIHDKEPALSYFGYDEAAPTVADTQLHIYSLYEDEDLRQMISQFQKANPDISVDLEIGLSGQDGLTEADAIRTLNTEILAGNSPDLIRLDGFEISTYLEKGLLKDVSHVLSQSGPLLEQVTNCYEAGGMVCAVPTTFALPAMYGPGNIVSQIHDLPSLIEAAKQAQLQNTLTQTVLNGILPVHFADMYYDSCSAAWLNEDGTLNEEKLAEYYAAMQALYAIDASYREENAQMLAEWTAEVSQYYTPGDYTGLGGAMSVCMGTQYLTAGTLDGMMQWSYGLAGDDQLDGFETIHFNGQASGIFLPRRIMGILTTGAHPQAAEKFLAFMLSQEVQAKSLTTGFPVNKAVFDTEIAEDRTTDSSFASGDQDGNMVVLYAQYPNASRRQELKSWVDNLTTPALTNRTIRSMVMQQMDDCCNGRITPEQAAQAALQALNLYLSE